jgi:hypothetical protein
LALAPVAGAANVTLTPDTGLPPESVTTATSGAPKAALMGVLWPLPLTTAMFVGAPAVFERVKVAELATPLAVAITLYDPTVPLAVSAGEVAFPFASVVTVADPLNVALAPLWGAVNVTLTPGTGLPPPSLTTATNAAAKALLIWAVCPPPLTAAIEAGMGAVFASVKLA